jgi:WD40 repeat protein
MRRLPTTLGMLSAMFVVQAVGTNANAATNWMALFHPFESKDSYTGPVATKIGDLKDHGDISSLDFSPDGRYLAASDPGSIEIHIWEWQGNSHIVRTLYNPQGTGLVTTTNGVRYSPDGKLIASLHGRASPDDGYGVIRIWDTTSGRIVHDIDEPIAGGLSGGVAFSPDGSLFVRSSDRLAVFPGDQLIIHRTDSWAQVWGLRTIPFYPNALGLSPNGRLVALGGAQAGPGIAHRCQLIIVDLELHKVLSTIDAFPLTQMIERLAWSPDGNHIAAGVKVSGSFPGPDAVKVFDISTGLQVAGESASSARVNALAYTPDGKYLIESEIDKTTRIWDGQHKNLLQKIPVNLSSGYTVGAIAVSRDSRYLAIASLSDISIWKLK